jgi:hypothetical protein
MDYNKTRELYQEIDQLKKFKETPDYNRYMKEQKWFERVKSKNTGEYYQAEYLKEKGMVPKNWTPPHTDKEYGKPLQYPLKYVNGIYRVRLADGSEWLKSTSEMWGLDSAGNALNLSWDFKECFDDVRPVVKNRPKDSKDRDSEMVWDIVSIESHIKYTMPFTPENAQKLYDMRNGQCNLVLKDESKDRPPYSVDSLNHFMTREFDELWE